MTAALRLLTEAAELGVTVRRHGDRLSLTAPTEPPAGLLEQLRQAKPDLLVIMPDENAPAAAPVLPGDWPVGIERMRRMGPPAGVGAERWGEAVFAADVFMTLWPGQAAALGWSTADLFGCQPGETPLAMPGGLVVELARHQADLVALTEDRAALRLRDGTGWRYLHRSALPEGMTLLWTLPANKTVKGNRYVRN